jgi:hypothetical protein
MRIPRFRDDWDFQVEEQPRAGLNPSQTTGFMVLPFWGWPQQIPIESLYRLAMEQAQAQIARERRMWRTAFSLN